jgi:GPH family glycoside/pentoside/hexuronide:cation symporter
MEKQTIRKATFGEILGFGLGELPGTANAILAAFLTMFYTDSIGMAAGAVGTMFFLSKIFDGISDLLAGSIIDKTRSKWGKARPWLLWLAVPTGLSFALMFWVPQNASSTVQMVYAFITFNLFSTILYTMVAVAKTAMMPLITQDGMSRSFLAISSLIFGLGGSILGYSLTVPFLMKLGFNVGAWRTVFSVYGIIVTVGMVLSFSLTHENVKSVEATVSEQGVTEALSFIESIKNFFSNKYFVFALMMTIAVNLNTNLNSGSQMYFYTYVMNDALLSTSLNLVNLIPTVLSIVLISGPCLRMFGKKKSVFIGAGLSLLACILKGLAGMTTNIPLLVAGTVLGGLSVGPLSVPINTLVADAVDYGEYLTGKRIEGMGASVVSFSQKLSIGIATGAVGWILQLTGYVANAVQNSATLNGIIAMFAWLPGIMLAVIMIGFLLVYKYDTEGKEVVAELERRKHGNE